MPELSLNRDALNNNLALLRKLEKDWHFRLMPVLKMVACHPFAVRALGDAGYAFYGAADIDEPFLWPDNDRRLAPVLINLPALHRAEEVVSRFARCAADSIDTLAALDAAASALHKDFDCLIMLDLGDMREGVPVAQAGDFFRAVAGRFPHLNICGIGTTMGCLYGAEPDMIAFRQLCDAARTASALFGPRCRTLSLGGSIFWNWMAVHHEELVCPEGMEVELRVGDPLLLGYDCYHEAPLLGGNFRSDLFELHAAVLEITERDLRPPRACALNGQGRHIELVQQGHHKRALLDCGRLHTDVQQLHLNLAGARVVDFSGNYTILDITNCLREIKTGDRISFRPGYWAVARCFRNPLLPKYSCSRG